MEASDGEAHSERKNNDKSAMNVCIQFLLRGELTKLLVPPGVFHPMALVRCELGGRQVEAGSVVEALMYTNRWEWPLSLLIGVPIMCYICLL